jgi:lactoylglutathione lyase/glyoxylase I family protein
MAAGPERRGTGIRGELWPERRERSRACGLVAREILGGGNPHPIPKPVYTDLGDSLRLAGFHHFCLNVASIDDTVAELRRRGVTIVTEPFELPVINRRLAFLADPWGLIELAQVLG